MLRSLAKTSARVPNLGSKVKFPARLKGTIVEKWADYWKNLFIDYKQMLIDLRNDIQDEPKKAFKWTVGLGMLYLLGKNNPDELDFKDNLKRIGNDIVMVSEPCQNPKSIEHLRFLETCYNAGVIHYSNLGIASIMYTSELNDSCDLYKSQCKYLQPSYFSFPSRIVDVGFMGRWWNIYIKTSNYDVN
ncbi:mitochondrial import inner membrane translocase subunit Tim29 [Pectinophora gossypiella]|uniref:mitochondrial import inner membrane translocase subunit Tim29 n=1 Tax=Pectinophora gossypiella TaxID=13191 RepID=UPI00214E63D2|nr:mitochondrial import inner membrane translocase subunit Tim29 [Pectinophora gossypiella]